MRLGHGPRENLPRHWANPPSTFPLWHDVPMRSRCSRGSFGSRVMGAVGCMGVLAACSPSVKGVPSGANQGELAANPDRTELHDDANTQLILWHSPAIGVKSLVKVRSVAGGRVLEVHRSLGPGFVGYWTVRFVGEEVKQLDHVVAGLVRASRSIATCPRRHGRDGVVWVVKSFPDQAESSLDFQHLSGGPECDAFGQFATGLMHLARLRCSARACLRPAEESANRFECLPDRRGDNCREAQDASSSTRR